MKQRNHLTEDEIAVFNQAEKICIVATKNKEGKPHITLLTTVVPQSSDKLLLGEFSIGQSKKNFITNPEASFLVLSLDRRLWTGTFRWRNSQKEGIEFARLNEIPMFRYNTYFGINTVHYLDLETVSGGAPLPMVKIGTAALLTRLVRSALKRSGNGKNVLPLFGERLFNRLDSLVFLSWIDSTGRPSLLPVIQCQTANRETLVFSTAVFGNEIEKIPNGAETAAFCMSMDMKSILVRGVYRGIRRVRGIKTGIVEINWVYNSMPPLHGQIYPQPELKAVEEF